MCPRRTPVRPAARPLLADVLLALGMVVAAVLFDTFGHDYRSAAAPLWDVVLAAPLALRRRAPATAAALIAAICLAQWLSDVAANGDLVVLIMLYSLGAWERRRWLLAAALVVAETGVLMAVVRWAPGTHQWLAALMATGTVTAALVLGLYVRTRRAYLLSMIERAETAERDRDRQSRIAVIEERARMAREMHDVIAHSLAVMITLNDAAAALAVAGTVRDTVTQASDVGRQALAEMQRMLGVLRGAGPADLVPQPGTAQLADLIAIVRSAGLSVELAISGDPAELAPTTQLAIYRIVQESLTNVLKHARKVVRVAVMITYRDDHVRVRITNDGEPGARQEGAPLGHGLAGIRERSALYGGEFHAGPIGSGGWEVLADLRLSDPAVPA
ncbi:MAG: histidine kinase [Actinomycetota bacterium]|nr:histidine kinase [Actinomycetota bacterium]